LLGAGRLNALIDLRVAFKDVGSAQTTGAEGEAFKEGGLSAIDIAYDEKAFAQFVAVADGGYAFNNVGMDDGRAFVFWTCRRCQLHFRPFRDFTVRITGGQQKKAETDEREWGESLHLVGEFHIELILNDISFDTVHTGFVEVDVTLKEAMELAYAGGVAHLTERFGFDLSDALTGNFELFSDFLKGAGITVHQSKTE
jgi:hypothetical protein